MARLKKNRPQPRQRLPVPVLNQTPPKIKVKPGPRINRSRERRHPLMPPPIKRRTSQRPRPPNTIRKFACPGIFRGWLPLNSTENRQKRSYFSIKRGLPPSPCVAAPCPAWAPTGSKSRNSWGCICMHQTWIKTAPTRSWRLAVVKRSAWISLTRRLPPLPWQADHFAVLCKDIPFYLRVANPPEGGKILLGQRKKGAEQFAGPIFKVKWNPQTQTLTQGPDYGPASSIHSLYQFIFASGSKERVLILEPDNFVSLYRLPEETLLDATDKNFGPYHEIPYPVRLKEKKYLGEFEGITCRDAFAPRRFLFRKEFQGQCFLIQKGRTESSGMKDKFFNLIGSKKGTDRIVGLRHRSGQIYPTWTSKSVPRDMIDFSFFKQEDGINLLSLVRDSQGYALEIIARKSPKTP